MHQHGAKELDPIETRFNDRTLLRQALEAHGFEVQEQDGDLVVTTNVGSLRFYDNADTQSMWVKAYDLVDEDELASNLGAVGDTYLQNVQRNNYLTLMNRVQEREDVSLVSEEVLDDDTIVVTIEV